MAENSAIEWTDTTWNPLAGCTRASEGCDNCYAAKMSLRLEAMALADIEAGKDPGGKRKYIGIATKNGKGVPVFNGKINLDYSELQRPYSWRKPRRVFVNSMSDLFHKDVPDGFIDQVFRTMSQNSKHVFQILTKRPDRAAEYTNDNWSISLYPHIWLGTSVENPDNLWRVDELRKTKAAVRFLSCEPLLGDLGELDLTGIQWVIVGGESGKNARPMHMEWVYEIVQQCKAANVPVFVKQMGDNPYYAGDSFKWYLGKKGHDMKKWPEALQIREFPEVIYA